MDVNGGWEGNGGEGERRTARWERGQERGWGRNRDGNGGEDPWTNTEWERERERGRKREQ